MENILAIPDIQDSILCHLSNEDLFNLGSINKSGHESVSYYSQRKLYQYINYFMKRLSKMSKQEDVPHYSQYMALYNYYVQIKQLYHLNIIIYIYLDGKEIPDGNYKFNNVLN